MVYLQSAPWVIRPRHRRESCLGERHVLPGDPCSDVEHLGAISDLERRYAWCIVNIDDGNSARSRVVLGHCWCRGDPSLGHRLWMRRSQHRHILDRLDIMDSYIGWWDRYLQRGQLCT